MQSLFLKARSGILRSCSLFYESVQKFVCFLRSIYQKRLTALEHDTEEEVLGVSIALGLPSYCLGRVVRALDPAGAYREAGMIQDAINIGYNRLSECQYLTGMPELAAMEYQSSIQFLMVSPDESEKA